MHIRFLTCALMAVILLASCHSTPDHTKYIPKDAAMVLGINTSSLGKKIAWNAFWGSKLLDEMKKNVDKKDLMKDMEKSGIKTMTTYYAYMKTDVRYEEGKKFFAVIPLDDAAKWEAYLKTLFPENVAKSQKDRKEVMIANSIYAAWNKDVLIIGNVIYQPKKDPFENINYEDSASLANAAAMMKEAATPDETATALEMDKAFSTASSDAVTNQKSFMSLSKEGHDISVWVNYESLAGDYMNAGMTGSITLSNSLWKGAAMAMGFDFEKGKIAGVVHHYIAEEMIESCSDFGTEAVDKELMSRLPGKGLNMLAGWHIAPKGVKKMADKLALSGLANAGLSEMGMSFDELLDAFNGSMGVSLNNFSTSAKTIAANTMYSGQEAFTTTDADIDYMFVAKIGKKQAFDKLLKFAVSQNLLIQSGNNNYIVPKANDTLFVGINDMFLAASNSAQNVAGYMAGDYIKDTKTEPCQQAVKHPIGMYFDVKSMVEKASAGPQDANSKYIALSRNLLSDIALYGGDNKKNTFEYNISIDFQNKEENSLIQLLNFASKMQQAATEKQVAVK
jgi:hypothetical protein